MITVTIYRKRLERLGACAEGLALYDAIADRLPESDKRRDRRIKIANWTRLHSVWPYVAGYGAFARWLEARGIIPRADFSGADLSGTDLSGADLSGANLYGANLSGADLSGADLSAANLHGATLSGANLSGADLYGANLYGANFSGADLSGVDLYGATLSGANLSGAYLYGANLSLANLSAAILSRADLSGAYRGSSSPIAGWRTNASGYLERDEEVTRAVSAVQRVRDLERERDELREKYALVTRIRALQESQIADLEARVRELEAALREIVAIDSASPEHRIAMRALGDSPAVTQTARLPAGCACGGEGWCDACQIATSISSHSVGRVRHHDDR